MQRSQIHERKAVLQYSLRNNVLQIGGDNFEASVNSFSVWRIAIILVYFAHSINIFLIVIL